MVSPDGTPQNPIDEQPSMPDVELERPEDVEKHLGQTTAQSADVQVSRPEIPIEDESDEEDNPRAKYIMGPGPKTGNTGWPQYPTTRKSSHRRGRGGRSGNEPNARDADDAAARAEYAALLAAGKIQRRELKPQPEMQRNLAAVMSHPRAGFIPKNRSEVTEILDLLPHIGNPMQRRGGVHDQLRRLADAEKARLIRARTRGEDVTGVSGSAVRSRLFEYTDHLASADRSIAALQGLLPVVRAQTDHSLTLHDLAQANPGITGLPDLLQYIDGLDVLNKGGSVAPFNQWVTRRNEDPAVLAPGQNKRLEDAYTGSGQTEKEREYITGRLGEIRVASVIATTRDALENAHREKRFWDYVQTDVGYEFTTIRDEVAAASKMRAA